MKCPNCDEEVKESWMTCPECHADLSKRKYSKNDDPVDKLTSRVNKIDEFLTEKFPVTQDPPPNPNDPPKEPKNAPKKKRTLFGD